MTIRRPSFKAIWTILAPVLFSPLLFLGKEFRCVYSILLICSYWIVEVVPIGITSLLPILLFPILGIQSVKDVCQVYFKDSIVLFMCTLVMALAVEETQLHRRIALKLLCVVGSNKQTMLFGFMCTTAFISFFLSDTACAALMVPIAIAVLTTMKDVKQTQMGIAATVLKDSDMEKTLSETLNVNGMSVEDRGFCKALVLSCAHGALIGGTAIITSTGPNLVFREMIQSSYPNEEISVSYLQWMSFAMPPLVLYLLASYTVLTCYFLGPSHLVSFFQKQKKEEIYLSEVISKNIKQSYEDLGSITFAELSVFGWFFFLISAWILRKPGFMPGWGLLFEDQGSLLSDSVPGILVVFIMFSWPKDPFSEGPSSPILSWPTMKHRFAWSCVLLIGGGYALSKGVEASGLSQMISCAMKGIFENLSSIWLQAVATTSICFMTEFASNVSTGNIFIPIVIHIAESLQMNPLYLALPTAVACSFAFMFPMATPANAIVYDTKIVSVIEMISSGFFLNIVCILITILNMNTWTYWLFDLGHIPEISNRGNVTLMC